MNIYKNSNESKWIEIKMRLGGQGRSFGRAKVRANE